MREKLSNTVDRHRKGLVSLGFTMSLLLFIAFLAISVGAVYSFYAPDAVRVLQYVVVSLVIVFSWASMIVFGYIFLLNTRQPMLMLELFNRGCDDDSLSKKFLLGRAPSLVIGTSKDAQIKIEDVGIKEEHAVLNRIGKQWFIVRVGEDCAVGLKLACDKNRMVYVLDAGVPYPIGINDIIYISHKTFLVSKI